jgi:hypothetical protein
MRRLIAIALFVGAGGVASAQVPQQTQHVPLSVSAIDKFAVTGLSPLTITINTFNPTTEFTTTYSITTNSATARRITAKLDQDLPAGVTINVEFDNPGGTAGTSPKDLTASPQNVVTGITHLVATPKKITYTITVAPSLSPRQISRTVTYTIE